MAREGEEHRLFCLDHRQDIRMFFWGADGAWHTRSLTAELGLPPARAMAVQRISTEVEFAWVLVFSDFDGQLWDVQSSGDGWTTSSSGPVTSHQQGVTGCRSG
jgi:hypothetical protein